MDKLSYFLRWSVVGIMSLTIMTLSFLYFSASAPSLKSELKKESAGLQQKRLVDRKQIYLPDDQGYREILLCSKESDLLMQEKERKFTLFETMHDVTCWIQEQKIDTSPSMQIVRYLEAAYATFDYETSTLTAKGVTVKRYQASGHTLPGKEELLLLEGNVETLLLPLKSQTTPIEAYAVAARLYGGPSLLLKGGKLTYAKNHLLFSDGIELEHPFGMTKADQLLVLLEGNHSALSQLIASGNVELEDKEGNLLMASQFNFDAKTKCCTLTQTIGYLKQGWFFSGKLLTADQHQNQIKLEGDIVVRLSDRLRFTSDSPLFLALNNSQVDSISSTGQLSFEFFNPKGELQATLLCEGGVKFDLNESVASIDAEEGKQLQYLDAMGQIDANQLKIAFHHQLESIELIGAVRLQQRKENAQYALADRLVYYPHNQQVQLFAKGDDQVIFYDPQQHLTISATSLYVKKSLDGRLGDISSPGLVRFTFNEKELQRLRNQFLFKEKNR